MSSDLQPIVPGRKRRHERAQSTLEFALVFPFFLVILFGLIDFAWALRSYVTITNAVREGARYGVTCQYDDHTADEITKQPEGIKQRVVRYSAGLLTVPNITVGDTSVSPAVTNPCATTGPDPVPCGASAPLLPCTYPNPPPADAKVIVKATYTYKFITPVGSIGQFVTGGVLPDQLSFSSKSTMRFE